MKVNGLEPPQHLLPGADDRYRLLVEGGQRAFIYQHDAEGRLTYMSPSVYEVLGFQPEELIGKTYMDLIVGSDDQDRAKRATAAAVKDSTRRTTYCVESPRKVGGKVTIEVTKVPVFAPDGTCVVFGVARDMTAQKRIADQLVLSAEILSGVDTLIVVTNGEGDVTYVNPATCRTFGKSGKELLRNGLWQMFNEPDPMALKARVARCGRGDEAPPSEPELHTVIDDCGKERWLLWRGTKGPGDLMIGCAHEITPIIMAENAMRKSEAQLRAMFDHSVDGILLIDNEGTYVDANPAACGILSVNRSDLVGKSVGSHCDECAWETLRDTGFVRGETAIPRPDGTKAHIEYTGRANIQPGQHLFIIRDMTERKKLEAQLRQSQKMEAVGRLAGGVAHDFNNMLTVIRGYSELMQNATRGNPQLTRYVECILSASDRAALITQQLLAFSRRQVIQPQLMNLNAVVEETARLLRRVIGEDIGLELSLVPELPSIKADPGQVGQIVMNLAVNARDAMPNGGHLRLATSNRKINGTNPLRDAGMPGGSYAVLEVTDSGCGMDRETQAHIFEPFFTTKPQGKGTGLGLATVYGIVKQSGGWIEVLSAVDQGTTFNVYFPLAGRRPDPNEPEKTAAICTSLENSGSAMACD